MESNNPYSQYLNTAHQSYPVPPHAGFQNRQILSMQPQGLQQQQQQPQHYQPNNPYSQYLNTAHQPYPVPPHAGCQNRQILSMQPQGLQQQQQPLHYQQLQQNSQNQQYQQWQQYQQSQRHQAQQVLQFQQYQPSQVYQHPRQAPSTQQSQQPPSRQPQAAALGSAEAQPVDYWRLGVGDVEELCKSRGIRCSHRVTKTQLVELLEDLTGEANWGYMTIAQLMGICKGCNIQTPKAKNTKEVMIGMLEEYDRVNGTVG